MNGSSSRSAERLNSSLLYWRVRVPQQQFVAVYCSVLQCVSQREDWRQQRIYSSLLYWRVVRVPQLNE